MKTTAIIFPFDLFGGGGAGAGAALLADELREVLADNRRERVATRAQAYTGHVRVRELAFATLADYAGWRRRGRRAVRAALVRGDFLLWVAGNHLGTLPVYDELSGADDVLVVQLDAHLDVHHFHDCSSELSHGNFLLHCAGPLPPLVNAGHRDLLLPADHVGRSYRRTFAAAELALDPGPTLAYLRRAAAGAGRVFLDIDCDVFDPAVFPAVAEPVPFGLSGALVLRLIDAAWGPNAAGVLLSEFTPSRDRNDQSLATAIWLIEYLLLRRYEGSTSPKRQRGDS
jgi:arginase family enzyme